MPLYRKKGTLWGQCDEIEDGSLTFPIVCFSHCYQIKRKVCPALTLQPNQRPRGANMRTIGEELSQWPFEGLVEYQTECSFVQLWFALIPHDKIYITSLISHLTQKRRWRDLMHENWVYNRSREKEMWKGGLSLCWLAILWKQEQLLINRLWWKAFKSQKATTHSPASTCSFTNSIGTWVRRVPYFKRRVVGVLICC